MGSSVPALPPPPPSPSAGGLCLLREHSIVWLGELWEEAGAVLLGQPWQDAPGQPGPALRLPSWELQPNCSAQPYLVCTHVEGGRGAPRRAAA